MGQYRRAKRSVGILLAVLWSCGQLHARDMRGRLGVGATNQMVNNIPALSIKLQRSRSFALGALAGVELEDTNGGHSAGLKMYRNLFEEPHLHFYSALMLALIGDKRGGVDYSGFQADLTLGSEFSFSSLESIGFSFEFGLSINNVYDETVIKTAGNHIITSGIHFYL